MAATFMFSRPMAGVFRLLVTSRRIAERGARPGDGGSGRRRPGRSANKRPNTSGDGRGRPRSVFRRPTVFRAGEGRRADRAKHGGETCEAGPVQGRAKQAAGPISGRAAAKAPKTITGITGVALTRIRLHAHGYAPTHDASNNYRNNRNIKNTQSMQRKAAKTSRRAQSERRAGKRG